MRTEEELRAALLALEREAPAAARVLPKAIIPNEQGFLPRVTRHRRLAGLTAALGTAAVIGAGVAVVVALLPGARSAGYRQASRGPETLRAKLLDALSAAGGEIIYDRTTFLGDEGRYVSPTVATVTESWYYPWQAKTGQLVRDRTLSLSRDGTPLDDNGESYLGPTEPRRVIAGGYYATRVTVGDYTGVDYATRTWYERQHTWVAESSLGSRFAVSDFGSPLSIWNLVHNGNWSVIGRTELDGRPAIQLKLNLGSSLPVYLWVDAQTDLPLRETTDFAGYAMRTDYQYLAPTPANLAKLTVPIPPGFRRTVQPPSP
jgi:hypothetical protein